MENHLSMEEQFLSMINRIIEENIDNENFSVEQLARQAGVSRSLLHRKLKKITGLSSIELITEVRLKKALELLKNNVATTSEIAYRVGFSDPSYFYKVFKKHYNISPGEVRNEEIKLRESSLYRKKSSGKGISNKVVVFGFLLVAVIFTTVAVFKKFYNPEISIAVLPFENLTGQDENNFFIDGLQDALIGELGKISSLRVISRASTLQFRDTEMLLPEKARKLGVKIIIEGSVQCFGDSLCLIIQGIDALPRERHLFATEYHDEIDNLISVQAAAVKDIAKKIEIKLTKEQEKRLSEMNRVEPESWKIYYQAMHYINEGTTESFGKGISYLNSALRKDPTNASILASFSLAYALRGHALIVPAESFKTAESQAIKAINIDPSSDKAFTALALIYLYQHWDWQRSKAAFEKALLNNPSNEIAHAHFAWYYVTFGDFEKAIFHAREATLLEPTSASYHSWLALLYFINKQYQEAENSANESLKWNENVIFGQLVKGCVYLENGQYEKALEIHEQLPKTRDYYLNFLGYCYIRTGNKDKALAMWNELETDDENNDVNPVCKGLLAGMLGYYDEAFELLNEAYDKKIYPLIHIETFSSAEFLKGDPRYSQLLRKMNIPSLSSKLAFNNPEN